MAPNGSAIGKVVQVVLGRLVTIRPEIFPLRGVVDDPDLSPSVRPRNVVGVDAVLDVVDRIRFGTRRPSIAFVAEAGNIPLRVLARFTHSTISHSHIPSVGDDPVAERPGRKSSATSDPVEDRESPAARSERTVVGAAEELRDGLAAVRSDGMDVGESCEFLSNERRSQL